MTGRSVTVDLHPEYAGRPVLMLNPLCPDTAVALKLGQDGVDCTALNLVKVVRDLDATQRAGRVAEDSDDFVRLRAGSVIAEAVKEADHGSGSGRYQK
jgi:hypothetical protein